MISFPYILNCFCRYIHLQV